MFEYLNRINQILNEIRIHEKDNILKVKDLFVDAVKNKKSIYCFGSNHAGILSQELFFRAGGMVNINPIWANDLIVGMSSALHSAKMERLEGYGTLIGENIEFKSGDILLVHSVSGRNPVIVDLCLYAKSKEVIIVGITNLKYSRNVNSRHTSGKKLYDLSDIVIDNRGDIGDACVDVGEGLKVGPSSTVAGVSIVNEIVVQTVLELKKQNYEPIPVFRSANQDGNDEINSKMVDHYRECIHYSY